MITEWFYGVLENVCKALYQRDNPTPGPGDGFGLTVAARDGRLAVASQTSFAGIVHVFDLASGQLLKTIANPQPKPNDHFGLQLAVNKQFVVASSAAELDGRVFVSGGGRAGSGGYFLSRPDASTAHYGECFEVEGNLLAVAAGGISWGTKGAVYLHDATTGKLLRTIDDPSPGHAFATSIALDAGRVAIGAPLTSGKNLEAVGQVYLAKADTGAMVSIPHPEPVGDNEHFGASLALRSGLLAVAAPNRVVDGREVAGAVYLYDAANPSKPFKTLANHDKDRFVFGARIAIGDHYIAITSLLRTPNSDYNRPAFVSLYSRKGNFVCDVPNPGDDHNGFGAGWVSRSVTIGGETIVVGAPNTEVFTAPGAGAVYAYQVGPIVQIPKNIELPGAAGQKQLTPERRPSRR
jgi:hypothetical protein